MRTVLRFPKTPPEQAYEKYDVQTVWVVVFVRGIRSSLQESCGPRKVPGIGLFIEVLFGDQMI